MGDDGPPADPDLTNTLTMLRTARRRTEAGLIQRRRHPGRRPLGRRLPTSRCGWRDRTGARRRPGRSPVGTRIVPRIPPPPVRPGREPPRGPRAGDGQVTTGVAVRVPRPATAMCCAFPAPRTCWPGRSSGGCPPRWRPWRSCWPPRRTLTALYLLATRRAGPAHRRLADRRCHATVSNTEPRSRD